VRGVRGVSNVIAVLALAAVSALLAVLGYAIAVSYLSRSLAPDYSPSATYAKLVFVASGEVVGGEAYAVYRVEVGIANPGPPRTLKVCLVAPQSVDGELRPRRLACRELAVDSGYGAYSLLVRVSEAELWEMGCRPRDCPTARGWYVEVLDEGGRPAAVLKPVYTVP